MRRFSWIILRAQTNNFPYKRDQRSQLRRQGEAGDSMLPLQGAQVPSLVRELRTCMLHSMAGEKNIKVKLEAGEKGRCDVGHE